MSDGEHLCAQLGFLSGLSDQIGGRVREIERSTQRAEQCLHRVEDLLDLRRCTEGVRAALANEDFELAAAHIRRFGAIDEHVLRITAAAVQGTC